MNIFGSVGHFISSVGKGVQDGVDAVGSGVQAVADLGKKAIDKSVDEFEKIPVIGNNPLTKALGSGVKAVAEVQDQAAHFTVGLVEGVAGMATGVIQLAGGVIELGDPKVREDFGKTISQIAKDPGSFFSAIGHNVAADFQKDGAHAAGNLASLLVPVGGELKAVTEGSRLARVGADAMKFVKVGRKAGTEAAAATETVAKTAQAAGEGAAKTTTVASTATTEAGTTAAKATEGAGAHSAVETELTSMRTSVGKSLSNPAKTSDTLDAVATARPEDLKVLDAVTQTPAPAGTSPRLWAQFRQRVTDRIAKLPKPVQNGLDVVKQEAGIVGAVSGGTVKTVGHLATGTAKVAFKTTVVEPVQLGYHALKGAGTLGLKTAKGVATLGKDGSIGLKGVAKNAAIDTKDYLFATVKDAGSMTGQTLKDTKAVFTRAGRDIRDTTMDSSKRTLAFVKGHKVAAYVGAASSATAASLDAANAPADPFAVPPVGPGAANDPANVSAVQTALGIPVTGKFDDATAQAIASFQQGTGLSAPNRKDAQGHPVESATPGVVNAETWDLLSAAHDQVASGGTDGAASAPTDPSAGTPA